MNKSTNLALVAALAIAAAGAAKTAVVVSAPLLVQVSWAAASLCGLAAAWLLANSARWRPGT